MLFIFPHYYSMFVKQVSHSQIKSHAFQVLFGDQNVFAQGHVGKETSAPSGKQA